MSDLAIPVYYLGWLQGYRPERIAVLTKNNDLLPDLQTYLTQTSDGMLSFSNSDTA